MDTHKSPLPTTGNRSRDGCLHCNRHHGRIRFLALKPSEGSDEAKEEASKKWSVPLIGTTFDGVKAAGSLDLVMTGATQDLGCSGTFKLNMNQVPDSRSNNNNTNNSRVRVTMIIQEREQQWIRKCRTCLNRLLCCFYCRCPLTLPSSRCVFYSVLLSASFLVVFGTFCLSPRLASTGSATRRLR